MSRSSAADAVATALNAAGGKNLEILGADVAGQCLERALVDEILVYVLPVLLGDGILTRTRSGSRTWARCSRQGWQGSNPRPTVLETDPEPAPGAG
jgi:dihydrofolate reductase